MKIDSKHNQKLLRAGLKMGADAARCRLLSSKTLPFNEAISATSKVILIIPLEELADLSAAVLFPNLRLGCFLPLLCNILVIPGLFHWLWSVYLALRQFTPILNHLHMLTVTNLARV
jgi:hypothetical protein